MASQKRPSKKHKTINRKQRGKPMKKSLKQKIFNQENAAILGQFVKDTATCSGAAYIMTGLNKKKLPGMKDAKNAVVAGASITAIERVVVFTVDMLARSVVKLTNKKEEKKVA